MLPELERLIHLQDIETRAAAARQRIAEAPAEIAALDARLASARAEVAASTQAATDHQAARRTLDRDLIAAQQRLSKYKEQLMAVKTNDEYHAMQHQISAATTEVGRIEELVIGNMLEGDDIAARQSGAAAALKRDETQLARERQTLENDIAAQNAIVERTDQDRAALLPEMSRPLREMFERVLKGRQGIAVAPAVDGHCSICHVRLRPQVFHTIVKNDTVVQCDSCQRILYFAGVRSDASAVQATLDAATSRQQELERPS